MANHTARYCRALRRSPASRVAGVPGLARMIALILSLCAITRASSAQTITMWHPWQKGAATMSALASQYTRLTGVRVEMRALNPASYNPWRGGSKPDIIGLSYPIRQGILSNARQRRLYNMESAIQQGWYVDLWPGPLQTFILRNGEAPSTGPGIYGVPLTVYVRAFIYNRDMFRRASVSPPGTWSAFLTTSSKLRGLGVVPLAGGLDDTYPSFPPIYEWSYLGSFYLQETYFGRYPYTGPRWQSEFSVYQEMRRYGVTTVSYAQMDRNAAESQFLAGKSAMILDGPWFITVQHARAPSFTNWGTFGPPVDRRAPFLPRLPGGVAEGAVINNKSWNRVASTRFLRWLTEPAQQVRLANALDSLPTSMRASSSGALDSRLRRFTPYLNYAAIELRYEENPRVLATLYQGARNVIRGTTTPAQALSATQRVKR